MRRRRSWKWRGVGRIAADDVGEKMYTNRRRQKGRHTHCYIISYYLFKLYALGRIRRDIRVKNANPSKQQRAAISPYNYYYFIVVPLRAANLQFDITFSIHTHIVYIYMYLFLLLLYPGTDHRRCVPTCIMHFIRRSTKIVGICWYIEI